MIDRTQKLQTLIDNNPGIRFREIMRSSGLKNGVLSYYLKKLESTGVVKVVRGPRQVRFYSPDITEEESIVITALRKETPRALLLALIKEDGLEFSQLVKEVKKSPSTVSFYLSQIVADGLVGTKFVDLKKRYHIKVREIMDKLVEEHRPGSLDKPTSGFEDIINSF
ncbi:MAG: winged helix-turn-helix transcriptional regulator [Candidatus Nitrosopelagicus sp.]|nr:winged helix-turn-helix transcriptional regulator [Candidatus Nitrosopelagicus sp.]